MAVANTKSTIVTNADSSPKIMTPVQLSGGRVRGAVATVEVAAADDDTSVYRLFRVHSRWRLLSLRVFCDAITAGTVYDFGLYRIADDGGAVVDADAYASDVDLSSAITAGTEITFEARNIDKIANQIWQDAGATSDPGYWYDLCATGDTVGSAAGTISAIMTWMED